MLQRTNLYFKEDIVKTWKEMVLHQFMTCESLTVAEQYTGIINQAVLLTIRQNIKETH